MTKSKLTRKLLPLTFGIISAITLSGCEEPVPEFKETYTIRKGDTVWGILREHVKNNPEYHAIDFQQIIYDTRKENNITNPGAIQPGQVIHLPEYQL